MTIHSEVEWVPVRSTQRKELVQITESNALDVIAEVGGAVYFEPGSKPRLSVGGTTREIGNWVDRVGSVWPDPHREGAPFVPESTDPHTADADSPADQAGTFGAENHTNGSQA